MKTKKSSKLKIEMKAGDAENFKSALQKISGTNKEIGFNKSALSEGEREVIEKLSAKINEL